jgi:hypothetical protein
MRLLECNSSGRPPSEAISRYSQGLVNVESTEKGGEKRGDSEDGRENESFRKVFDIPEHLCYLKHAAFQEYFYVHIGDGFRFSQKPSALGMRQPDEVPFLLEYRSI